MASYGACGFGPGAGIAGGRLSMANPHTPALGPIPLSPLPDKPLVSVLMSNYNYGHYVTQAIESVLAQTYPHFELVICDDGSTDNSRRIIRKYTQRDPRVTLVVKPNGGQASGFNAAFRRSKGAIICFLDADDTAVLRRLEVLVDAFRSNPDAGLVLSPTLYVDEKRRQRGVSPLLASMPTGWTAEAAIAGGGVLPYMPGTSGLNLRSETARRVFPLPESQPLSMCPDMLLGRLAPLVTSIATVAEPLVAARLHGDNTYMRGRISVRSLDRELELCRHLWQAQRKFLAGIDPELARKLKPWEHNGYALVMRYMRARLAGDPASPIWHKMLLDAIASRPDEHRLAGFWKASIHLPRPLFWVAINLLMTHNALKAVVARWKGAKTVPYPMRG